MIILLIGLCTGLALYVHEKHRVGEIIIAGSISTAYAVEEGNHDNYFFDTKDGKSIRITTNNGKMSTTNEFLYSHKKIIYNPATPNDFIVLPYKDERVFDFFWLPLSLLVGCYILKKLFTFKKLKTK